MRDRVYWIAGPWRGRLAILPRPRGGDWLEDETRAWRTAGLDAVVTLLEASEESELDLAGEAAAVGGAGRSAGGGIAMGTRARPKTGAKAAGRAATKVTRSSGNVFRDLGFAPAEAEHLRIRSALMVALRRVIEARGLTQAEAAALLGVTQPRVSDLVRGKIDLFSIDTLVDMLARAGLQVDVVVRQVA